MTHALHIGTLSLAAAPLILGVVLALALGLAPRPAGPQYAKAGTPSE